jgi:hypothetical protein
MAAALEMAASHATRFSTVAVMKINFNHFSHLDTEREREGKNCRRANKKGNSWEKWKMLYFGGGGRESIILNVAIFSDIAQCSLYVNRCFGGTHHFHHQGRKSAS